ncbi:MAG: biotin--[acetyl-CoA-carboxylase] ligase [Candidatus Omnitrophica bacterium]|nr:biotin--[acetyl-CoA-carboxylase] ligase [Candidatus Omnitrophota bacterium]
MRRGEGEYVSGEELSRLAGVSRTAIWKEIEKLRGEGYKILAQPHEGYRLVEIPDRLTAQELTWNLQTKRIGRRVHAYESTDSTMDVAQQLAAAGEPEGSVVVAEGQNQGRGRVGRRWLSPKGKGIYCSAILRPSLPLSGVAPLTLLAAVAVARAVESNTGLQPQIKWPNDVLIGGKKLAGILTELNAELNRVRFVILGIGLNVNTSRAQLPAHSTSLAEELGEPADRVEFARVLLVQLDRAYDQFIQGQMPALLEAWRRYAVFLGHRIRVALPGRTLDGQALDVDPSGALLVRTDAGMIESISTGDVLIVR